MIPSINHLLWRYPQINLYVCMYVQCTYYVSIYMCVRYVSQLAYKSTIAPRSTSSFWKLYENIKICEYWLLAIIETKKLQKKMEKEKFFCTNFNFFDI